MQTICHVNHVKYAKLPLHHSFHGKIKQSCCQLDCKGVSVARKESGKAALVQVQIHSGKSVWQLEILQESECSVDESRMPFDSKGASDTPTPTHTPDTYGSTIKIVSILSPLMGWICSHLHSLFLMPHSYYYYYYFLRQGFAL